MSFVFWRPVVVLVSSPQLVGRLLAEGPGRDVFGPQYVRARRPDVFPAFQFVWGLGAVWRS
eukprot:206381-Lingulodinium_polyedra.AAC.1